MGFGDRVSRALPTILTALALCLVVAGVYGLAGPWWACLAAAPALLLFVVVTDFEGGAKKP